MSGAELTGYTERFSVAPGERLPFMVSSDAASYQTSLVRLRRVDWGGSRPVIEETELSGVLDARLPGRRQQAAIGSFARIEDLDVLRRRGSFTVSAWVWPTTPAKPEPQGLLARWSPESATGWALVLGREEGLALWVGTGAGEPPQRVSVGAPPRARSWCFVAAVYDADAGEGRLWQAPSGRYGPRPRRAEGPLGRMEPAPEGTPLLLAAAHAGSEGPLHPYNGKLEDPALFTSALEGAELERLQRGDSRVEVAGGAAAAWDLGHEPGGTAVHDRSGRGLHGRVVNGPTRAVTGRRWSGEELDFRRAPAQYAAIHFHDDDLEDAGWEADFELEVPADLPSGVYAARLRAGDAEDRIPFVVRPRRGASDADVAVVFPTLTYLAYANERLQHSMDFAAAGLTDRELTPDPLDDYLAEHPELGASLYDSHGDGSGCCLSTRLRPIVNMRPDYRVWILGGPRHFGTDLLLTGWLNQKGFAYDVLADEDVHEEGDALLSRYRCVVTGSHPEYATGAMLDALDGYLDAGGRLIYLGGNGFYWVTSIDPLRPHVIEVRRGHSGTRAWESLPGELHHASTGEPGGLWRHRGRPPNRLVGVGFAAQGWDKQASGYRRRPESRSPRADFVFEGVDADEPIGDFGIVMGGAAGDELDRYDPSLGSPEHALRLASSGPHSRFYQLTVEDVPIITPGLSGDDHPDVRADMVFFETRAGGAVFSTSAISWCASLPHDGGNNNVSRITENVLRRFLSRDDFELPAEMTQPARERA